jgi:hypothetical protein
MCTVLLFAPCSDFCNFRRAPLEAVQGVAVEAVVPLFRAAVDSAEQHILRMHAQDFGAASAPAVAGASPYMADLTRHIALCRCHPSPLAMLQ